MPPIPTAIEQAQGAAPRREMYISDQAALNMPHRVVDVPVRGRLDISTTHVMLPFAVIKAICAEILSAEANSEAERIDATQRQRDGRRVT